MSDLIARVMAQRRVLVWLGVAALAVACLAILVMRIELDSDVINMLPKGFESVQGLKIYDRDFEQARELTFALRCQPADVDKLEAFDPLGIIGPALKPFAEANAIEQEQPLTSPDRTMRVFLAVTNQPSLSAFECQRLMREVNAFRTRASDGWDGGPLGVLVTGRSAYVAEISLSMRYDIVATLGSSVLLVGIIFFIGFRRWLPLLGMGFSLLLSCLVALAAGLLVFGRLSMVAVGFCAILVGLGVDFAILIFGRYQQARIDGEEYQEAIATSVAKLGRAVFFGALTTAVGFLALILSGSMGFSQLGVLIAIGIFFAGLFMCTILFLFVRPGQAPQRHDWVFEVVKKYVRWSVQRPAPMIIVAGGVLLLLSVIGFSPVPPLRFEASVRSLEPKNSRAAGALQAIMAKMPTRWEPVLAIVHARDAQELHDDWQRITAHWTELQQAGKIKGFSTPAALCLSPVRMEKNREHLRTVSLPTTQRALEETLNAEGFTRDSFAFAFKLLDDF